MKWEMIKIGDFINIKSGGTPSRKKIEYFKGGTIPWIKTGDLKNREIFEASEYITESGLLNSSAKLFPKDTLLVAMYGATIGACSILRIEASTNQACAALFPNSKISVDYLYYFFKHIKPHLITVGVGGAQPNISATIIKQIKIPLPPLTEQKRIAQLLDTADALRQRDKALLEGYDELLESVFLEMFGDVSTGENVSSLGELLKVKGGYAFKSQWFKEEGDIPVIKIGAVNKGFFDLSTLKFISEELAEKYTKWKVYHNDLLMSLTGTVGKEDYGNIETPTKDYPFYMLNQRVAKLDYDKEKVVKEFLYFMFKQPKVRRQLTGISRGVRQANISNRDILNVKANIPPISLQSKFAQIVQNIEAQKEKVRKQLEESEDLFGALMQEVFG